MSPSELLDQLIDLGTIDTTILAKIKKQIDDPDKVVKSSAILKYLIQKNQITDKQARGFLKLPQPEPAPVPADDPDERPPAGAGEPNPEPVVDEPVIEVPEIGGEVDLSREIPASAFSGAHILGDDPDATRMDSGDAFQSPDDASAEKADRQRPSRPADPMSWKVNKKDQWQTKWLYIAFGILGTILIAGTVLWFAVMGVKAEDQFKAAMGSFDSNAFQDAVKKFDEYIEANPGHKDIHKARARRAQAVLAGNYTGSQWEEVLKRAKVELPPLADDDYKESELPVIREDLSVMLPGSLMHITEKATDLRELSEMEAKLVDIEGYKEIVDNPVYVPASLRKKSSVAKNLDAIDNNIRMIKGSISKEKDYSVALKEIGELGEAGKTDDAFKTWRKLTRNYGDLASRQELRDLMLTISSREADLVQSIDVDLATSNAPAESPIARSVVLATLSGTPVEGLRDEVVNFLAEGAVYGLDAGNGSLKWKRFVGYETTIQPQRLDDDSLVIVDQRRKDLLRVDRRTGEVIWRSSIGETVLQPAVAGPGIFVTTESGKLIRIDSQTGQATSAAQLPQQTNTGAAAIDRAPFVYQAGSYSNLYVMSADDLKCQEVYYVGHNKNRISIPPYMWSGHLLVAVNGGDYCDLHVLRPGPDGLGLELVQLITRITNGRVTSPLQRFGRWMFMLGDNGDMRLLELDTANELTPVRVLASDKFDNPDGQAVFALTEGSNMWLAAKGMLRYRVQRALGQFKREVIANHMDTFVAPPQRLDENVLHVRKRNRSGMISASLVDGGTLKPIWRSDFGGAITGTPRVSGNKLLTVNNQGDLYSIGPDELDSGYTDQTVRSSEVVEDLKFRHLLPVADDTYSAVGPIDRSDLLYVDGAAGASRLLALEPPADTPACKPMAMGGYLIVPSVQGQIARIAPKTGRMKGTPFQPPIKPGTQTQWFDPLPIVEQTFAITSGPPEGGATASTLYLIDASKESQLIELGKLVPDGNFVSPVVLLDDQLFAVIREQSGDAMVSISANKSLSIGNQANLPGKRVDGPWTTGNVVLTLLDNDQLVAVDGQISPLWSVQMPNEKLAFAPQMAGQNLLIGFQSGRMVWLNPETGAVVSQSNLGQPVVNEPLFHNEKLYFSGLDGAIHEVDPSRL